MPDSFQWRKPLLYSCASGYSYCSWLGLIYYSFSQCAPSVSRNLFMLDLWSRWFSNSGVFVLAINNNKKKCTVIYICLWKSDGWFSKFICQHTPTLGGSFFSWNMGTSKSDRGNWQTKSLHKDCFWNVQEEHKKTGVWFACCEAWLLLCCSRKATSMRQDIKFNRFPHEDKHWISFWTMKW